MLGLKCAPSQGLIHCPTANKDSGETIPVDFGIMTLNTSAFETATPPSVGSLPTLSGAAAAAVSSVTSMAIAKVINELPSLSFDQRSLTYLVDALCKLATGVPEAIAAGKVCCILYFSSFLLRCAMSSSTPALISEFYCALFCRPLNAQDVHAIRISQITLNDRASCKCF
ncbi:unnamed protein product [Dibothriocephalus latus]|uniref:Uncharacterized protein n=1 Tax=Dibothriocephalus latus TaxID=60516 RepID=A0A3P7NS41_DIBLA|nr:unnamed protein product [Dibothriocephalus latus]